MMMREDTHHGASRRIMAQHDQKLFTQTFSLSYFQKGDKVI